MNYEALAQHVRQRFGANDGILQTTGGYCYGVSQQEMGSDWCRYLTPISKKLAEALDLKRANRSGDVVPLRHKIVFKHRQEILDKLAVNSNGDWVMEEKGTGQVFTAQASSCEEVKPYTILVRNTMQNQANHYTAKKDEFNVGDAFVTSQGEIVTVVKVDTKQDNHKGDFKPTTRIVTEAV